MEPERKIEKLLRSFAKKRRDEAGDFKLHSATRRMLQNEVARRAPKRKEDNLLWQLFSNSNPVGWILGTSVVPVIILIGIMLLPSLNRAKSRAKAMASINNLKQIGVASKEFAKENNQRLPQSLSQIQSITDSNALVDPATGQPFVYVAGGRSVDSLRSNSVLAYSPGDERNRAVLFADGHVETVSRTRFSELTNRGLLQLAAASAPSRRELVVAPMSAPAPVVASTSSGEIADASKVADAPTIAGNVTVNGDDFEKTERTKLPAEAAFATAGRKGLADRALAGELAAKPKTLPPPPPTAASLDNSLKLEDAAVPTLKFYRDAAQTDALSVPIVTQNFAQTSDKQTTQNIFKNAAASAHAAPVLANFQFQQNGSAVAVVDEDGSIYKGYVVAAADGLRAQNEPADSKRAPAKSALFAQKIAKDSSAPRAPEPAENYFFQVSGTNRSLQQNVVFNGNVLVFSNLAQSSVQNFSGNFNRIGGSGGGNKSSALEKNAAQQSGVFSNARIAGTAVVNNTNQIEINALPVGP